MLNNQVRREKEQEYERRRREIDVEQVRENHQAPSGAASAEDVAPERSYGVSCDGFLQRCRANGAARPIALNGRP